VIRATRRHDPRCGPSIRELSGILRSERADRYRAVVLHPDAAISTPPVFHTYVGASIVAISTAALFAVSRHAAKALRLPNSFDWQDLSMRAVAIGAMTGAYSHVLLDSVMHPDIRPFAPFSDSNPLLGATSVQALHWSCVVSGLVGVAFLGVRSFRR
jgi:hypothetical protein